MIKFVKLIGCEYQLYCAYGIPLAMFNTLCKKVKKETDNLLFEAESSEDDVNEEETRF